MNAIEHLEPWAHPDSYAGFSPVGDYVVYGQNRDSDLLTRTNWAGICEALGAQPWDEARMEGRPMVYHFRQGHWAIGWVETLLVRADAPDAVLTQASEIACRMKDYPVFSDDDWSNAEFEAVMDYWAGMSTRERVEALSHTGLNIFAARRDWITEATDPQGSLFQYLAEDL